MTLITFQKMSIIKLDNVINVTLLTYNKKEKSPVLASYRAKKT